MRSRIGELQQFVEDVAAPGVIDTFVLLGMGGSSLAPHVLNKTFEGSSFHVLDTTHPAMIRHATELLDLDATLFIVSSKSGTTLETRSQLDYFWEKTRKRGEFFVAITDPGSELEALAKERGFLRVFDGEPTIGGRYSALSVFGMVPAALLGIDLERLLDRVDEMAEACRGADGNPGLELGLDLGAGWQEGRDKVTINPNTGDFGLWAEQLLAESTGKDGKGLVPAPGESRDGPDRQAPEVRLPSPYELGQEFFRWEFATAVAGSILGINAFDQPNVQAAKDKTNEVLAEGGEPGRRAAGRPRGAARRGGAGRLRRDPGVRRPGARGRARAADRAGAADRLRRDPRPRPALPALDGPAPQGRPEHRPLRAGRRRARRRGRDPRAKIRLPAADPRTGRRRPRLTRGAGPQNRASQIGGSSSCNSEWSDWDGWAQA